MINQTAFIDQAISLPDRKPEELPSFEHQGVRVYVDNTYAVIRRIRLISKMDNAEIKPDELRNLGYDLATTLLSETTNNDACDVIVRERTAHFSYHDDIPNYVKNSQFGEYIVVDVTIEDELS